MTSQDQLTFDLDAALTAKDAGIDQVSGHNVRFIDQARAVAVGLAETQGEITADDVRKRCEELGIEPDHYNAWGGLFSKAGFRWTGRFEKSANVKGHGNLQRVWVVDSANLPEPGPEDFLYVD